MLATFTVTRADDGGLITGELTLRQAIEAANTNTGILDTIDFAIAGAGVHTISPTSALPTITDPVIIDGYTQGSQTPDPSDDARPNTLAEGSNAVLLIELSGAGIGPLSDGLLFTAGGSTVRGLVINRFSVNGVELLAPSGGITIEGNYIGTDATGTVDLGNTLWGVYAANSPNSTIGGTTPGARNVISGNGVDGVHFFNGTNYLVQGNYIGTDASGTLALGNSQFGVAVFEASNTTIGGTTPAARNVISGNVQGGVSIGSGTGNLVQGNYIGTDAGGTLALGNSEFGVVALQESNSTIGGTTPAARNVISGNDGDGVLIDIGSSGILVQGNYIGTDFTGALALGNSQAGVATDTASNNTIGGVAAGAGNTIAFNRIGVRVADGTGNAILTNSIHDNVGLGIDLGPGGSTPNDPADLDVGGNNLQNAPLITGLTVVGGAEPLLTIDGILDSAPDTDYRLEFFSNPSLDPDGFTEGRNFLDFITVTTDSSGNASFSFSTFFDPDNQYITATATDPAGNTSEFSLILADLAITKLDDPDPVIVGQPLTYTLTVTNKGPLVAVGAILVDRLPANLTFVSASRGSYDPTTERVIASLGDLAAGQSVTMTIVVIPNVVGTMVNSATVTSRLMDPTPADNTVNVPTTVVAPPVAADLAIMKLDVPDPVVVGQDLTYTLTISNRGPATAAGASLVDFLPAGVTFVSASRGGFDPETRRVVATLGELAAGQSIEVTIVVTPRIAGTIINTATVSSRAPDPTPADNVASVATTVIAPINPLIVTNTLDAGLGSLRLAILAANGMEGLDTIIFRIPGEGPFTIRPPSPLPPITDPTIIDATTQPGFAGRPIVAVDGTNAGAGVDGLTIKAGSSTVRGLSIHSFGGSGIVLQGLGGNILVGNFIGLDPSGTADRGNAEFGVEVDDVGANIIGGTTPGFGNVISGNDLVGIRLTGLGASSNQVLGNYIGTDAGGNAAVPNFQGILLLGAPRNLIGGTAPGAGNVISGNSSVGIQLLNDATVFDGQPVNTPPGVATGNVIEGNLIGTNAAGTGPLGNFQGVFINDASGNRVGGTSPGSNNVISGNSSAGIQVLGDNATGNLIQGNSIGTDRSGTRPLGNDIGVFIYAAPGNVIDRSAGGAGNIITFNRTQDVRTRTLPDGPTVASAEPIVEGGTTITCMVVTFTMYMDIDRANDPGRYILQRLNAAGRPVGRISIARAVYNEVFRTVQLFFDEPLSNDLTLRLRIRGAGPDGLTDRRGNFLNGANRRAARGRGSDFVAVFRAGEGQGGGGGGSDRSPGLPTSDVSRPTGSSRRLSAGSWTRRSSPPFSRRIVSTGQPLRLDRSRDPRVGDHAVATDSAGAFPEARQLPTAKAGPATW